MKCNIQIRFEDGRETLVRGVPDHLTLRAFVLGYYKQKGIRISLENAVCIEPEQPLSNLPTIQQGQELAYFLDLSQSKRKEPTDEKTIDSARSTDTKDKLLSGGQGLRRRRSNCSKPSPSTVPKPLKLLPKSKPIFVPERSITPYRASFYCSKTKEPFDLLINALTPPNEATLHSPPSSEVEIVFLIDTSGSMNDEIEGVKSSCLKFADHIGKSGAKLKVGLVGFDIGGHCKSGKTNYAVKNLGEYTIGIWSLTNPNSFKDNVKTLQLSLFGGAGCYVAESGTLPVFNECCSVFSRQSGISRTLVLISDEMGSNSATDKIISQLKSKNITAHVLGCTEEDYCLQYVPGPHQEIARCTGGSFWPIRGTKGVHDFTNLLSEVAETIARGLRQRVTTVRKGSEQAGPGPVSRATVLREIPRASASQESGLAVGNEKTLAKGEGFDILENFRCPRCGDNQREQCPHCGVDTCATSGRMTGIATCPACGGQYEPQESDAVHAKASRNVARKK